jgi:uncharacterized alkaline shock family protein YloU
MSSQEDLGQIQINDDVLATIAQYAALEVDGVVGIAGGTSLSDFLGAKTARRGIVVTTDEQNSQAVLDLDVNVEFGLDIYHVATHVQRAVKHAIEGMTGLRVKAVNVKINSVVMSERAKQSINTQMSALNATANASAGTAPGGVPASTIGPMKS